MPSLPWPQSTPGCPSATPRTPTGRSSISTPCTTASRVASGGCRPSCPPARRQRPVDRSRLTTTRSLHSSISSKRTRPPETTSLTTMTVMLTTWLTPSARLCPIGSPTGTAWLCVVTSMTPMASQLTACGRLMMATTSTA